MQQCLTTEMKKSLVLAKAKGQSNANSEQFVADDESKKYLMLQKFNTFLSLLRKSTQANKKSAKGMMKVLKQQ